MNRVKTSFDAKTLQSVVETLVISKLTYMAQRSCQIRQQKASIIDDPDYYKIKKT